MKYKQARPDATYRLIPRPDMSFAIEVTIPEMQPTIVTRFATTADAEAWIAAHKQRAAAPVPLRRRFGARKP